ncbi:anaphase-promoting complex subunit 5 [Sitodiplosis mosellana]|uniref:anaphase-promoting complex subunit 5 n=1 Tax=Sitodiplosis mosellana TaxID=263140 RepID=UPI0024443147|nr:anaphase-promoting complex subunit 5 [Sitodiplosis mosellana]
MDTNRREFDPLNIWPNAKTMKIDKITPHKIVVVFLVQEYLKVKSEHENHDVYPAKYSKRFCMLLLKLIQFPDMSYKDLHSFLSNADVGIDPNHLHSFEELMETISTVGLDVLFDLQMFIGKLLTDNLHVNQFGVVGFYIRRILLALNKMGFEGISDLYESIIAYYEKGIRAMAFSSTNEGAANFEPDDSVDCSSSMMADISNEARHASKRQLSLIMPSISTIKERNGHSKWSVKQADLFIAQQCNLLENNEIYALKPIELQQRLNEIIDDIPLYTQAHALTYLNSLRVRDFFSSLDSYHRAYDQNSSREIDAANAEAAQTSNNGQSKNANRGLQYSSLNLAILHMKFEHYNETLSNLRECIMLAQEAGDKACLQLAQLWLCLLDKKYVLLCETNVTNQLENTAVHSVSLGVQFVVNVAAISGVVPSKLFELLMKSEVINFQHSLMDLVANSCSQKAAVWQLYGKTELASLCNQLLLQVVRSSKDSDCIENSEAVCLSLCSIALWLSVQGEHVLSAVVIQHAAERFPRDPLSRNWQMTEAYIQSQQSIHRCKWTDGLRACSQIRIYNPVLSALQQATLNISRGNGSAAYKYLQQLLNDDGLEPIYRVRTMILMSNTFVRNELAISAEKRFSAEAMGILNEASVYAKEKFLSYEAALVDLHTTYVLLLMGMPQQALKLIRNCMETILANGGIYDCTRTQFLFVKCLIAAQGDNHLEKINKLLATLPILDECIQNFMKLEAFAKVKDIYIYLSIFYESVGLMAERNKWACKFRYLDEQFPTPTEYLNVFL